MCCREAHGYAHAHVRDVPGASVVLEWDYGIGAYRCASCSRHWVPVELNVESATSRLIELSMRIAGVGCGGTMAKAAEYLGWTRKKLSSQLNRLGMRGRNERIRAYNGWMAL